MIDAELIGSIGAVLFLIAWIPPTVRAFTKKKSTMDIAYCLIALLGALFFGVYGYLRNDLVISIINIVIVGFAFINFYYIPRKLAKLEKGVEHAVDVIEEDLHIKQHQKPETKHKKKHTYKYVRER